MQESFDKSWCDRAFGCIWWVVSAIYDHIAWENYPLYIYMNLYIVYIILYYTPSLFAVISFRQLNPLLCEVLIRPVVDQVMFLLQFVFQVSIARWFHRDNATSKGESRGVVTQRCWICSTARRCPLCIYIYIYYNILYWLYLFCFWWGISPQCPQFPCDSLVFSFLSVFVWLVSQVFERGW